MATHRPPAKKKIKSTNGCFVITILLIILVTISLLATFYFLFLRPVTPTAARPATPRETPLARPLPQTARPVEPAPPATLTSKPPARPVPAPGTAATPAAVAGEALPRAERPRIAIIIDDIGNNKRVAEGIIALDLPLAFSILPNSPFANHLATLARARGRDLLLHLPMEANDGKWSPTPGTLLLSMSRGELIDTINRDLDTPYSPIGINNHMGSKFSTNPVAMRIFLSTIKSRGLFFIDSFTAVNSVGYSLARDLGIETAKRDIFLDNDQDQTKILAQIGKLIILARTHGSAIGIGHPYPATLEALRTGRDRLLGPEVAMVPVHELVR